MSPFFRAGWALSAVSAMPKSVSTQPAVRAEEQVRRFHVAVHDSGVVDRGQGGEQLQAERGHGRRWEPAPATEEVPEGATRVVVHHQPGGPVVLKGVVDRGRWDAVPGRRYAPRSGRAKAAGPVA